MTKWPEKKLEFNNPEDPDTTDIYVNRGFNQALELCRKAVEEAVDEGRIMQLALDYQDKYWEIKMPVDMLAQAIRKHILKELFGDNLG